MLKLKTKTPFTVISGRVTKQVIIRLIVENLRMDINNVIPSGYYYYFNEDNEAVILDRIVENPILWSDIALIEQGLPAMTSTSSLFTDLNQRLSQLVAFKLHSEGTSNYGTTDTDYIIDND